MKQRFIIIVLSIIISTDSYCQTDTTLQRLLAINYTAYKGHTVDSLVRVLPSSSIKSEILFSHRADYGDVLIISYPNDVYVWIQVSQFKYMNPWINKTNKILPPTSNWDINLFKKESIACTIIYQGAICKTGCENDPQATAP